MRTPSLNVNVLRPTVTVVPEPRSFLAPILGGTLVNSISSVMNLRTLRPSVLSASTQVGTDLLHRRFGLDQP